MHKFKLALTLVALLFLTACVSKSYVKEVTKSDKIDVTKSFYVAIGKDGDTNDLSTAFSKDKTNVGSAKQASIATKSVLNSVRVVVADKQETIEEALATAKREGFDYMVYPQVVTWTDRNYMICGSNGNTPDQAIVNLQVYDVNTATVVNYNKIEAYGCEYNLSFIPFGLKSPTDFYEKALKQWLKTNKL